MAAILQPLPPGYPHWVKFYVDGGTLMAARHSRKTRGVYWSMLCEDGPGAKPVLIREQDLKKYKTNNDAEWLAVLEALQYAAKHHTDMPIVIYSDSMLVVKQFNGQWRVKLARHHYLYDRAKELARALKFVIVQWVPRQVNVDKLGH